MGRLVVILLVSALIILMAIIVRADKGVKVIPKASEQVEEKWAIIIGIDDYEATGIGKLKYATKDAEGLYQILTSIPGGFKNDNIVLMTKSASNKNHNPTRNNIIAMLSSWLSLPDKDDTVLFYFSGHGIEKENTSYILPQDAKTANLPLTVIGVEYIKSQLRECKAQKRILILDSCHSGSEAGKNPITMGKAMASAIESAAGMVTLASCDIEESSYDIDDEEHGAFTYYLMEALKGKADRDKDGKLWASEVNYYVWDNTRKWAAKKGLQQTPKYYVSEGQGEIVLAKAEIPEMTQLRITVVPSDATVTLTLANEPNRPIRPDSPNFYQVERGLYRLSTQRDGYVADSRELVLNQENESVAVTLERLMGILNLWVTPTDATVMGTPLDIAAPDDEIKPLKDFFIQPTREKKLPIGTYRVTAKKEGWETDTKTVEIKMDIPTRLNMALKPLVTNVILITLIFGDPVHLYRSDDMGINWFKIKTDLPVNIASLIAIGTTLFAGAQHEGGIYRSDDMGNNWVRLKKGMEDKLEKRSISITSFAVIGTTLFASTRHGGVFRSDDMGNNWIKVDRGMMRKELSRILVTSLAVVGTTLFAGTDDGVFRSDDRGNSWIKVNKGLTKTDVYSLAVVGTTLFAITGDGIFRYDEIGRYNYNWIKVDKGLAKTDVHSLAVIGTTLFAGTDGGVYRSEDMGNNWANTGLMYTNFYSLTDNCHDIVDRFSCHDIVD